MSGATVRCRFPVRRGRGPKTVERRNAVGEKSGEKPVSRAARMLALAHHVERLVDAGELETYSAAAQALGLTRARLTQVMNLLLLAPKIQERIAAGELVLTERALRRVLADPVWEQQRATLEGRSESHSQDDSANLPRIGGSAEQPSEDH